ncbi:MAG: SRPBCC family protein [Chitinophagaceae bacterium]
MKTDILNSVSTKINAPASRVWDALTKPALIKRYFFNTDASSDWTPGSPVTFKGEWQGKKYEDKGTVLDSEPCHMLRYTYWSSMSGIEDKPENYVTITYELEEENGKTNLTVSHDNISDEKMRKQSEENWKKVLKGLKEMVENE